MILVYVDTSALVGGLLAVLIILAAVAAFILWNKGKKPLLKLSLKFSKLIQFVPAIKLWVSCS